jgi:hypothetical protein
MPTPIIKEGRLPELHLRRMRRDDIVRAISDFRLPEIRVPDIDLSKVEPPRVDLRTVELPDIELPNADTARRAIRDIAVRLGLRKAPRPRWPMVAGVALVAGLVAFAVTRPDVRRQIDRGVQKARGRIEGMRSERSVVEIEPDDIATPIAPSAWTDDDVSTPVGVMADDPIAVDALEADGDGIPAFEEPSANPV